MKIDCRWFSTNLEAFFCESLGTEDFKLASEHLQTCLSCRKEFQALHETDPLVKQVLAYRMTKARAAAFAPRRSMGFQLGLATAAVALLAVLGIVIFNQTERPKGSANQSAAQSPDPSKDEDKGEPSLSIDRTKPDAPDPRLQPVKPPPEPAISDNAPEFQVITPEGYSKSLQDYRNRILLFGVWSADRPETSQNLQRLYQAFGTRRDLQILGISSRGQDRPAGMTFPMVFNNGSRLLETRVASYAIVDKDGRVQWSDTLVGDSNVLISKVRAKLDELGAH